MPAKVEVQEDDSVGAFTIADFEKTFRVGHTKACEEIASGRLETYRVGRRRYISRRAAIAWQRAYEAQQAEREAA